jgi:hypothetical protein
MTSINCGTLSPATTSAPSILRVFFSAIKIKGQAFIS